VPAEGKLPSRKNRIVSFVPKLLSRFSRASKLLFGLAGSRSKTPKLVAGWAALMSNSIFSWPPNRFCVVAPSPGVKSYTPTVPPLLLNGLLLWTT
jgi:hypothetical protein